MDNIWHCIWRLESGVLLYYIKKLLSCRFIEDAHGNCNVQFTVYCPIGEYGQGLFTYNDVLVHFIVCTCQFNFVYLLILLLLCCLTLLREERASYC